ncbi:MAG: nitrous oxide-stimulated promoter family protein [Candidatus Hodarchaeales archaeon]
MLTTSKKIQKEQKTVQLMIDKFCKGNHMQVDTDICENCMELSTYSNQRLEKCVFGEKKPFCSKCPIHCYKPSMREKIKEVMKYSGPRMIYTNPILAVGHLLTKYKRFKDPRMLNRAD